MRTPLSELASHRLTARTPGVTHMRFRARSTTQGRTRRFLAACWSALTVALMLVPGCTGEDENAPGMLAADQALRNPQTFLAFVKLGMAVKIAECHFTPDQARALAEVAEAQGPAIRADVDTALAEANTAAAKLSSIADSVVTAEDPEEAVGQAMMKLMTGAEVPANGPPPDGAPVDAFAERFFGMFSGEGPGIGPALDKHAADVEAILATMDASQRIAAAGIADGVERVLTMYAHGAVLADEAVVDDAAPGEEPPAGGPPIEDPGMAVEAEEPIDPILACTDEVIRALGFEDPQAEPWAIEAAQPIVEEFMALSDEERPRQVQAFAKRLAVEITGGTEQLAQKVRRTLLAIAGYQEAPGLLSRVANR